MQKNISICKKTLDFYKIICYNVEVAWRDGRVGLRRTTGNRVNPNTVSRVRIPFSPPKGNKTNFEKSEFVLAPPGFGESVCRLAGGRMGGEIERLESGIDGDELFLIAADYC